MSGRSSATLALAEAAPWPIVRRVSDTAGAGWAWWQWREDSPWGIRDTAGHTDTTVLAHLARPYLSAAPAGVRATGADGVTGALTVRVDSTTTGGQVEIAWPLLSAAAPNLSGSCAGPTRWDSVRARLTLTVAAGAACVAQVRASARTT